MSRIQKDKREVHDYLFQIFKLWSQGWTLKEIGDILDKNHTTIGEHIHKHKNKAEYRYAEIARKRVIARRQELVKKAIVERDKKRLVLDNILCLRCNNPRTKHYQTKFCSAPCARIKRFWPKWQLNEKGERVCTGKLYREYFNEDKK